MQESRIAISNGVKNPVCNVQQLIRAGFEPTGNRCGHNPSSPRFFEKPDEHKPRPKILTWAMQAWDRFYSAPAAWFPELRFKRQSTRRIRSEAREAIASIAQVMLHYTELASLRVGVPQPTQGFRSLTIEFLAKKAGLGYKRTLRAIEHMKQAGYLTLIERFETKNNAEGRPERFVGLAAVKCLTLAFFKACGISLQHLSAQRRQARKRLNKRDVEYRQARQKMAAPALDLSALTGVGDNAKSHMSFMRQLLQKNDFNQADARQRARLRRQSLAAMRE